MKKTDNIYAPPKSALNIEKRGDGLISDLEWKSTWWLLFLAIITLGIYIAHYAKRQSAVINSYSESDKLLKVRYVTIIMLTSYLAVILLFPSIYFEVTKQYEYVNLFDSIDKFLTLFYSVYLVIWSFEARSRVHQMLSIEKGDAKWMNGFLTFFFTAYYVNYKINIINKSRTNKDAGPDVSVE